MLSENTPGSSSFTYTSPCTGPPASPVAPPFAIKIRIAREHASSHHHPRLTNLPLFGRIRQMYGRLSAPTLSIVGRFLMTYGRKHTYMHSCPCAPYSNVGRRVGCSRIYHANAFAYIGRLTPSSADIRDWHHTQKDRNTNRNSIAPCCRRGPAYDDPPPGYCHATACLLATARLLATSWFVA